MVALVAFVLATIAALLVNLPGTVTATEIDDLRAKVDDEWDASGWEQQVASFLVDYLASLRKNNNFSSWLLTIAIALQIAGIAATAVTALIVATSLD